MARHLAANIPGARLLELRGPTIIRSRAIRMRCWTGSSGSWPRPTARMSTSTGCWRPCCSPTSSARPRRPRGWPIALEGPARIASPTGPVAARAASRARGRRRRRRIPRGLRWPGARRPVRPGDLRGRARARARGPRRHPYRRGRARRGDVRGIAVHIGARVAAEAGPGEVLVSSTVKDLVAGSGLAFESRGAHALKGVPDAGTSTPLQRPIPARTSDPRAHRGRALANAQDLRGTAASRPDAASLGARTAAPVSPCRTPRSPRRPSPRRPGTG